MFIMVCKKCGKALANSQPTCPFCGAFIASDQMEQFLSDKKEQSKDLRPKLVSERYGMKPYDYEKQNQTNNRLLGILIVAGILVVIFLLVVFLAF